MAHLMSVAAMVLEDGGNEEDAIAALLHDAVEDIGAHMLPEIAARFGADVAAMVEALSDSNAAPGQEKGDWRERKLHHLDLVRAADTRVLRILAADKLHNLRSLNAEHRALGEEVWRFFNAGRENTFWYLEQMNVIFQERIPESLIGKQFAGELERLCSAGSA